MKTVVVCLLVGLVLVLVPIMTSDMWISKYPGIGALIPIGFLAICTSPLLGRRAA